MNRSIQIALLTIALGAMAAAQAPVPPAPPAPAKPARPARPPAPPKPASYLGIDIRDVTHDNMAALQLKEARGVEITMVDGDAPAGKAGLKEHDVIQSFNGRNIQSSEELRKLIRQTPPGQAVELGISRDGRPMTVKTQLADRRNFLSSARVSPNIRIRIPKVDIPAVMVYPRRNGIVVENLTPQLGEVFGVKNGEGVLVRSVEKESAGGLAGLRAGDVIVRVGGQSVADASDWNRLMREQKAGPVQLGIIRDKRSQAISVTLPERSGEPSYVLPGMEGMEGMEGFTRNLQDYRQLGPEIQQAMRDAQEKIRREFERSQRELERSQREVERSLREQERAQREAERAQERAQQQAEREQRDAERQQERAQREAERAQERAQQQAERAREQAEREREKAQEQAEREREKSLPPEAPPAPAKPPTPPQ